ncbi:MAG: type II secretion system protein GspJ [Thermodesulfobacteriota bacterium]|nr:type II secretion system protein GspJ [Thermodesulfobacteriota bacterium]
MNSSFKHRTDFFSKDTGQRIVLMKQNGFTLAEILMAISIFSIILVIIYSTFSNTLSLTQATRERIQIYEIGNLALDMMAHGIHCAFISQLKKEDALYRFIGNDIEEDGIPRDQLHFVTTACITEWHARGISRLSELGYYVKLNEETESFSLFCREDVTIDDAPSEGGIELELAEHVKGLDFKYYDSEGNEWDDWDSQNESELSQKGRLPKKVKITIVLEGDDEPVNSFSRNVFLPLGG